MDHVGHTSGNGHFFGPNPLNPAFRNARSKAGDGCADQTASTPPGASRSWQCARPAGE
ncbi:hypothetical protein ID875_16280 [Streptomyces globisporus]|uniref:Uncharacterized protein n=1 Tax=Streptomyces globisporus TaxID=1908 RepID=A0A927BMJ8_STRGL|nr:hypothetical protein [Streptomyces globisporus]